MMQSLKKAPIYAALAALLSLSGCDMLGVLIDKGTGGDTIAAQYKLPKDQPVLVLVESFNSAGQISGDAYRISHELVKNINDLNLAKTVKPSVLDHLQGADPEGYRHMQITEIGRACKAKFVLYMNLTSADINVPQGESLARGELLAYVKVIDCSTGETQWPMGAPEGQPIAITTRWERNEDAAATAKLRDELAVNAATLVSQIFYEHSADEPVEQSPQM